MAAPVQNKNVWEGSFGKSPGRVSKLQKALVFPDELQNSETIEAAINQHFAHLHGVLQNVERRMIDKLHEQRNYMTRNLNDIQQHLKIQEEQVRSGLLMAAAVNDNLKRISLKDVISKLERLADVPCHLVQDPVPDDEKIMFSPDPSIIEILEKHCKIELPEVAGFNLLTEDTLPMDYEIEPLPEEMSRAWDDTFSLDKSLIRTSSCQSLSSRRSEPPVLKKRGYNSVHVCYIESPSNFYVRLASHKKQTSELKSQLADYAANKAHVPHVVEQNKIYAVHRYGNKWYRGRVNAINTNHGSPDTYEIFNLDYGRTDNRVNKSRMRSIPDQIALTPPTIINCALYDIVPKDGKWQLGTRASMIEFVNPTYGRALVMHVVNVNENIHLVDICKEPPSGEGILVSMRDSLIFSGHGTFVTSQQLLRTCPLAVRRFFRENLTLNTYHNVKCSYVDSPDCIYVQKSEDHLVHLAALINEMSTVYKDVIKNQKGMIHVPEIGMPCAVEKAENVWCRGIINNVPAPEIVEVLLVDFGSKITTNYEKIRKLNEQYMVSPGQAIKVSLADITHCDGLRWSDQAIKFTKEHIEEQLVRIIAFEKSEFGYNVALYIRDNANFAAILVSSGSAVSTGPRSSGVAEVPIRQSHPRNQTPKVHNAHTVRAKKRKSKINGYSAPSVVEEPDTDDPFRVRVKIIRAESPDTIYVADPIHEKVYEEMMAQMQTFYNQYKEVSDKCEWAVDFPCAVYSTRDKLFCRGKITTINSSDEAQVFLYDLAFTETVPITELQALKKKFWETRTYAFKVKLAGITPCGGSSEWPSTSCLTLKSLISENQNSKFYITKVDNPDERDLYVELWVEQVKIEGPLSPAVIEVNSINRMLVESGLALPIKQYNEKTRVLAVELKRQISHTDQEQRDESSKFIENVTFNAEPDGESVLSNSTSSAISMALNECTLVSSDEMPTSWLPAEVTDSKVPDFKVTEGANLWSCTFDLRRKFLYFALFFQENMLRSIETTLEAAYAKLERNQKDLVWKEGDLCIAQYHNDKKWYRAQVRKLKKEMIEVEFIDYGSIEDCEIGMLRKSLIMTDIPRQCTKCVIFGLYPNTPTHKWTTRDLDKIHYILVTRECEVTVLKRMEDYLVVSVVILNPVRCDLIKHLIKELDMDVRVDFGDDECSGDDMESTIDDSDDVIVDGYVKDKESGQEDEKDVNEKGIEKDEVDVNVENNEETDDDDSNVKNIDEDKSENDNQDDDEGDDQKTENKEGNESIVIAEEVPIVVSAAHSRKTNLSNYFDDLSADGTADLTHAEDVVLSGTANFTHSGIQIELTQQELMGKLETISLPDSIFLKEDQLITSTPFDISLDSDSYSLYKRLVFPDEVKVVKAKVAMLGFPVSCLHLLDNKKSEFVTSCRNTYECIVADMQKHAEEQPNLNIVGIGSPCCVKFSDGLWYRCCVFDCESPPHDSDDIVEVRFVDWGDCAKVRVDEVRAMKEEWFAVPHMSFSCRMWGAAKAPTVCDDLSDKLLKAYRNDVYVELKGCDSGIFDVQVYSDEDCTELIYDSLLNEGLFAEKATTKSD